MRRRREGGITVILRAADDQELTILFEPAGGPHVLQPEDELRLVVTGPVTETVELSHGNDWVSVWPSPRLSVRVYRHSGEELAILGYQ